MKNETTKVLVFEKYNVPIALPRLLVVTSNASGKTLDSQMTSKLGRFEEGAVLKTGKVVYSLCVYDETLTYSGVSIPSLKGARGSKLDIVLSRLPSTIRQPFEGPPPPPRSPPPRPGARPPPPGGPASGGPSHGNPQSPEDPTRDFPARRRPSAFPPYKKYVFKEMGQLLNLPEIIHRQANEFGWDEEEQHGVYSQVMALISASTSPNEKIREIAAIWNDALRLIELDFSSLLYPSPPDRVNIGDSMTYGDSTRRYVEGAMKSGEFMKPNIQGIAGE